MQNIINGVHYCGKPANGLAFKNATRPIKNDTGYACPEGYEVCQESFLSDKESAEYAICLPVDKQGVENCPITSFAFTLEGMTTEEADKYQQALTDGTDTIFYYSKSVKGLPIDELKITGGQPCWDMQ